MHQQRCRPSSKPSRNWWVSCLLAIIIIDRGCAGATWAITGELSGDKAAAAHQMMNLQDGMLTAHVTGVPLPRVMSELSRLSGARIVWLGQRDNRPVSVDFTKLPLAEALPRLLGPNNFLLLYSSTAARSRLKSIWVAPRRSSVGQTVAAEPDPVSSEESPDPNAGDAELEKMVESHLDTALHGTDRDSRVEAVGFLGGLVEYDPRIRPLLTQLSTGESDPQVRAAAAEALAGLQE